MIARTQGDVQLPYWCKGDRLLCTKAIRQKGSGSQFPKQACSGNHIPESALKLGHSFPSKPLPETVSHLEGQNWDAVSEARSPAMLRNNGRAFVLSMRTEGNAPGLRAGTGRGENPCSAEIADRKSRTGPSSAPCAESPSPPNMKPQSKRSLTAQRPRRTRCRPRA